MATEDKLVLIALDKVIAIDNLIQQQTDGNALDLARKIGISRSTFFRLIKFMRSDLRAPIIFNSDINRYVYDVPGKMVFGFVPDEGSSYPVEEKSLPSLVHEPETEFST